MKEEGDMMEGRDPQTISLRPSDGHRPIGNWNCPWIPEKGDCRDITTKINRTASTISHSMTNLNQLVETKRSDTRIITEVTRA